MELRPSPGSLSTTHVEQEQALHNDAPKRDNDAQKHRHRWLRPSRNKAFARRLSQSQSKGATLQGRSVAPHRAPSHAVTVAAPPTAGANKHAASHAATIRGRRPGYHVARMQEPGRATHDARTQDLHPVRLPRRPETPAPRPARPAHGPDRARPTAPPAKRTAASGRRPAKTRPSAAPAMASTTRARPCRIAAHVRIVATGEPRK